MSPKIGSGHRCIGRRAFNRTENSEDHGFTAVDNLPLALVDPLIALEVETGGRQIAIGLDARTSGFSKTALDTLTRNLRKRLGGQFQMVFVTAAHGDLMRRYNATRREHPLGANRLMRPFWLIWNAWMILMRLPMSILI